MRIIELLELQRAILKAISEKPDDYKDPNSGDDTGCMYTYPEGNHCIMGQALENMNAPVPDYGDPQNANIDIMALHTHWLRDKGVIFTKDALKFAQYTQTGQDDGLSWSKAFVRAMETFLGEDDGN